MSLERTISDTKVEDIMSKQIISADPSTTLFQISKLMEQGIGAILVKKDSIPVGIITDRDFAIKIAAKKIPLDTTVDKVASYPLKTINHDESVLKAAELMTSLKIRKLVVLKSDKIVGIVTSTDIVNLIAANS